MHQYRLVIFFFKQKTAYEIRNCDWSSDVCSSDLHCLGNKISNQNIQTVSEREREKESEKERERERERSEERRVGKECRSRWSPYH